MSAVSVSKFFRFSLFVVSASVTYFAYWSASVCIAADMLLIVCGAVACAGVCVPARANATSVVIAAFVRLFNVLTFLDSHVRKVFHIY